MGAGRTSPLTVAANVLLLVSQVNVFSVIIKHIQINWLIINKSVSILDCKLRPLQVDHLLNQKFRGCFWSCSRLWTWKIQLPKYNGTCHQPGPTHCFPVLKPPSPVLLHLFQLFIVFAGPGKCWQSFWSSEEYFRGPQKRSLQFQLPCCQSLQSADNIGKNNGLEGQFDSFEKKRRKRKERAIRSKRMKNWVFSITQLQVKIFVCIVFIWLDIRL